MKKEIRTIYYDEQLHLEAYYLGGIVQTFPNHFHEYYVIGLIESGYRLVHCKQSDYILEPGDIVLFMPGDNHGCAQYGEECLCYIGLNIPKSTMLALTGEITGQYQLPCFTENILHHQEVASYIRKIHQLITHDEQDFQKEEMLYLLISILLEQYSSPLPLIHSSDSKEIESACSFLKEHYCEKISLEQICKISGLSKSTLLRSFTKNKGVTPYRYLENIRINKAKKLLEEGLSPIDVAIQTGFTDQSHFTNFFTSFIGITPGSYRNIFNRKDLP